MFRLVRRPRCERDYDDMFHSLEGTLRLTDADGVAKTFGLGDSFAAAELKGAWESIMPVRYV